MCVRESLVPSEERHKPLERASVQRLKLLNNGITHFVHYRGCPLFRGKKCIIPMRNGHQCVPYSEFGVPFIKGSTVRRHLAFLTCSVREKEMVPVLKSMVEDEDPDVRYFSDEALTTIVDTK